MIFSLPLSSSSLPSLSSTARSHRLPFLSYLPPSFPLLSSLTSPSSPPPLPPLACYNSNDLGQSYQGTENRAENGRVCIPWASFRDTLPPTIFPSSNYCRNPGQLRRRPWCFTTAGGDWNYCNITVCGDEATSKKCAGVCVCVCVCMHVRECMCACKDGVYVKGCWNQVMRLVRSGWVCSSIW